MSSAEGPASRRVVTALRRPPVRQSTLVRAGEPAAALLVIAPGPDSLLVLRNSARGGRRAGLATAAGTITGLLVWAAAAGTITGLLVWAAAAALGLAARCGPVRSGTWSSTGPGQRIWCSSARS
jgi:hypothetical protein